MRGATLAGHVVFAVLSAVLSPEFSPKGGPKCSHPAPAEEPYHCASQEDLVTPVHQAAGAAAWSAAWLSAVSVLGCAAAGSLAVGLWGSLGRRLRTREIGVQTDADFDLQNDGGRLPTPRRRGRGVLTDA